jgi:TRAP-type C4-dicarboxylate transport system substrate-binding protein
MREQWDKRVDMSRQKVMEAGVKIIENPDLSYFSDAMTPVYEQFVISEKMRYLLKRIQETKVGSDS